MPVVRLLGDRIRGDESFAAGDEYPCSDAEAASLIELGFAEPTKSRKHTDESTPEAAVIEAAVVEAPEKAVEAKPKARG